jgi:hypothetical protein
VLFVQDIPRDMTPNVPAADPNIDDAPKLWERFLAIQRQILSYAVGPRVVWIWPALLIAAELLSFAQHRQRLARLDAAAAYARAMADESLAKSPIELSESRRLVHQSAAAAIDAVNAHQKGYESLFRPREWLLLTVLLGVAFEAALVLTIAANQCWKMIASGEKSAVHAQCRTLLSNLDNLTALSAGDATCLAENQDSLSLNGLTAISEEAAKSLAEHRGYSLSLNGLTTIPVESAKALGSYPGMLSLDGLIAISGEAAKGLAGHRGDLLCLNGLKSISAEAAEALAPHRGLLLLDGLTSISSEAAKCLAEHRGDLSLDGLTSISAEVAESLAGHRGHLGLNGLTAISVEVAKCLATHRSDLRLNGLTAISEEVAGCLAEHRGKLSLDGLTEISDEVAKVLASQRGALSLTGLGSISDAAVTAFANRQHRLVLPYGITLPSDEAWLTLSGNEHVRWFGEPPPCH